MRLGFARGVSPSKWAARWAAISPKQDLELVPLSPTEVDDARSDVDVLLERVAAGSLPFGSDTIPATRHAIRLYAESVALVAPAEHELSDLRAIALDELSSIDLLDHPDHPAGWPEPIQWRDSEWKPQDAFATLNLVESGAGLALMSFPLARHLAQKKRHAVIPVVVETEHLLTGPTVWASWEVERDAEDVQRLVGVLRGRTTRSSR